MVTRRFKTKSERPQHEQSETRTSIDGKSLVIEEPSLEGVLHLGPVNDVVFGLQ